MADKMLSNRNTIARIGGRRVFLCLRWPRPEDQNHEPHSNRRARGHTLRYLSGSAPGLVPGSARAVREDREPYLSDRLPGETDESGAEAVARTRTKGLRKAMRDLDEALNLAGVLRAAIAEDGDSRAMQVDTVLAGIEKKLDKAHTRMDRHEGRCWQFVLDWFELTEQSEGREPE